MLDDMNFRKMLNVYCCKYRLLGASISRYVIARDKSHAVELIYEHYSTLSSRFKVTDITVHDLEFISTQTINNLKNRLHGNR